MRDRGPRGDLNGDGRVNYDDILQAIFNWGKCPCCVADLNGDEEVDDDDLDIIDENWTG